VLSALTTWAHRAATALLVAIVAINGANVLGRYALNAPLGWAEEIMVFCMIGLVFGATPAVTWQASHVRMDIAVQRLPPKLRRALAILTDLISVAVLGTYVCASVPLVLRLAEFRQVSDAATVPLAIPQGMVPLGLALMVLVLLARLVRA
jgi:TRAP-type C4-dicarboxylate transport system permease small subunit